MIQAVIFDMDGTMIDSEKLQSDAFAAIITQYGKIPIPYSNGLVQPQGLRGDETWKLIKEKYGIQEDAMVLRMERRKIYEKFLETKVETMPGLLPLLTYLKKKNIKMAVVSSSPKYQIQFVVKKFSLTDYFPVMIGGEDVTHGKPHPEPFLTASMQLSIDPKNSLVVEDAENGIIAAKKAGMTAVALLTKYSRSHNFFSADYICSSLKEIMERVDFN